MSTTDVVRIAQQGPSTDEDQGRLKADLQYLKRRSLFKAPGEISYQGRKCTRCGAPFGRFYNTGAPCTRCRHRVCRQCRIEVRGPADNKAAEWICNLCYKIAELHVVTGEWMYEGPVSAEHVVDKRSTVDLLRHSIRRAWTINGPPTRWSAARKSPELRLYRSLPTRHQDYRGAIEGTETRTLDKELSRSEETRNTSHREQSDSSNDCFKDEPRRDQQTQGISRGEQRKDGRHSKNEIDKVVSRSNSNERNASLKRIERSPIKQEEEASFAHTTKQKKTDKHIASTSAKTKDEESVGNSEQSPSRISLIKPPKILSKLISPDFKIAQSKHGERKSNIPIFRRSSKEFEDIRSPQESPKRSLIPQRYRGSTDDLRRSREDISLPSLIPKLLTPRGIKEERLKRQDSKDDVRPRSCRRDSKDESPRFTQTVSSVKEDPTKIGSRIFRRENSREDVGRNAESASSGVYLAAKGKQQAYCREERQERAEERVGDSNASKLRSSEQGRTTKLACEEVPIDSRRGEAFEDTSITNSNFSSIQINPNFDQLSDTNSPANPKSLSISNWDGSSDLNLNYSINLNPSNAWKDVTIALDENVLEKVKEDRKIEEKVVTDEEVLVESKKEEDREREELSVISMNERDAKESMKENAEGLIDSDNAEASCSGGGERKMVQEIMSGKKQDDYQVVRRKFSKEEFSNPDDTDDTPNKRCSSHLSPEASPLSTRSSRYSPRESESEPTPALPRKTGGDSCSASQRIRDAITRTRRESNSSARYESSGSESVRLSETGLHGYVELARKVKFLGGTGNGTVSSIVGCDEIVQRDSATSAGEDDVHDDNHGRAGPVSSQGRTMLRRRRQFDAQGSRRRGRSHARSCCSEDLQSLQALHVIARGGGRQPSPTNQSQDQPIVDYRRLVFISSDSSSGREEDDADSSCSSSSYLNGLPRGGGHAQSLEDCDWDYFESGTLPLPTGVPVAIGAGNVTSDPGVSQDWSCCPGRGSSACQACGGSRGANVLPVPVPIPVPVPYPVPVPAALWTGDFAAAASSMISRGGDAHSQPGTLRLRGDPAAPWFAWHPRFNQPLHGARLDPRLTGVFEAQSCGFRPDQILTPRLYESVAEPSSVSSFEPPPPPPASQQQQQQHTNVTQVGTGQDENDDAKTPSKIKENLQLESVSIESNETKIHERIISKNSRANMEETGTIKVEKEIDEKIKESDKDDEKDQEESLSDSFDRDREDRMYQHLREDSGSSSGRSSADSSDLEEDSSSHRFSRVFVVNDDSLTSDNDIEDNEEEDSDSATEGGVALKRVTGLPDEDPVILQHVRLLNEDSNLENSIDRSGSNSRDATDEYSTAESKVSGKSESKDNKFVNAKSLNHVDKKKSRGRKNNVDTDDHKQTITSSDHRLIPEEVYLPDNNDSSENPVELKGIKNLDPDYIEEPSINIVKKKLFDSSIDCEMNINQNSTEDNIVLDESDSKSPFSTNLWDSNIIPDSLELPNTQISNDSVSFKEFELDNSQIRVSTPTIDHEKQTVTNSSALKSSHETSVRNSKVTKDNRDSCLLNNGQSDLDSTTNVTVNSNSTTDSSTNNESNTTGSEVSSDELHEYEVNPPGQYDSFEPSISAVNDELLHTVFRRNKFQSSNSTASGLNRLDNTVEKYNNGSCYQDPNISTKLAVQLEKCQSSDQSSNNADQAILKNSKSINDTSTITFENNKAISIRQNKEINSNSQQTSESQQHEQYEVESKIRNVSDIPSTRLQGIFKSTGSTGTADNAHDVGTVRGENPGQVVEDSIHGGGECSGGKGNIDTGESGGGGDCAVEGEGSTRFRSVERRPSTRKENGFPPVASTKDSTRDAQQHFPSSIVHSNSNNSNNGTGNNRYRSLVMITQEASYQPVSVITSDTTTLLQPDEVHSTGQGLAGYFQLALESVDHPHRKNGQGPRKPLMVKRSTANQSEPEVDSGLSVGSASESDDVSVKNASRNNRQKQNGDKNTKERQNNEQPREATRARASSQSSDDNSSSGGVVILEEGLADDDSWVEEVSHDEDEQATTATEESSEDEANNLGDREEELRGYNRQAIDLTLHTIIEESCEESEAEPSLATGSPSKKARPPSATELEKYFFFGLGGDGNNSSMGSREVDSLSETSSIYSEGLESLGQDEPGPTGQSQERSNNGDSFLNSSRLEKYFLSEFLGFDQDRRDSDGSVGSDSEGRPSPEAQRRKKLVRARGTGRSHSSSLDNLLALTQSSQNLSSQNSLQDLSLNQDAQETQSEGSSTETDGGEEAQTPVFGTDGQFDTVKRKKKKPRNIGTQSPRVPDDRNKTPEPAREMVVVGEVVMEAEGEAINSEDSERAKTPQPEIILSSSLPSSITTNTPTSSQLDSPRNIQLNSGDSTPYGQRSKQQSRDSGFVGSCDDLLQHQKSPDENSSNTEVSQQSGKDRATNETGENATATNQESPEGANGNEKSNTTKVDSLLGHTTLPHLANASLSRKDSFNNWSSDEETNLMMSKMRQFFKTMVATSNGQSQNATSANSSGASPAPSPRLPGYSSKSRLCSQNRTKPPQLVYFENELTRLMKTVPGIRDDQVREIVEYLSSEDTWSDSYDSSDYTSSDLEGAAGGRRSALQEQISQSCQQIISKFDTTSGDNLLTEKEKEDKTGQAQMQPPCLGRDTAFVYQKLVQSFTKMAGDGVSSDANSTPHSSPPLIAKVMHHIGSRLVALMHEVSEGGPAVQHHPNWRRYSQHHRTPSSASTTEDDDSTSDSTNAPSSAHLQLPRSKSHDPLLLINNHPTTSTGQEGEEREASDYERFSWRGSFESALMAADSRTKLSLLACSGDVSAGPSASANALAMAAKRRSAGDLLFNPKSFSREQLDRVRSCGSIGGGSAGATGTCSGSIEERIWSNRRRSSVPDANTRGESGASAGDEDTEDELEYGGESRATTLPRGMQAAMTAATNSLPRLPASTVPTGSTTTSTTLSSNMHKAHSVYHFLPQHTGVKSARYRPPGFARNSNVTSGMGGPKRAVSAPGLQVSGSQTSGGKRDNSRSRRQQAMSLTPDDGSSLSEACSTPIIGAGSRASSSHTVMDMDDMESGLHGGPLATRASLSSLGARSDSMASVYSGAGEGRCCRSVVVTGEVEFALQYDYKHLTFEVHVTKCKNLAPVDVKRKRSDPYVKVYLLPDKSKSGKRKTKVKKHTLNPEFNETLKFHMSLSGLETRTLWLTVWHSDMFGRNDFLGEVRMPLENKIFDDPTPKWYPLQERTEPFDDPVAYKGEVIVGLKFVPPDPAQQERERESGSDHRGSSKARKNWSRGALHVLVKEARNLQTRNKNSGTCDPFCKSYLLPDKGRSGKQKTGVVRRSGGSPVWGHTFIYKDVSLQELAERGLELTVWDHDRIASNEFLGGVRFNLGTGKHYGKPVDWMDATGRELSLWQSMLERPNFWVEGAVTLRPNLHNHGKNNGS